MLSDQELTEAIKEHLKEDGRIDVDELHVAAENPYRCHGFAGGCRHLEILGLLWQTEKRTREIDPEIIPRWQEPPGSEDIVESMEEDKDFVAPAKPTANEE